MKLTKEKLLSYSDVTLVPRHISEIRHRSECDTSVECFGIKLDIPIIAAPMPDVCNGKMCFELSKSGTLGIIHRFQSIDEQVTEYKTCGTGIGNNSIFKPTYCGCAIGVTGDYQERFQKLYDTGCRIFCLDTANGANIQVKEAVNWIKEFEKQNEKIYIIAGNIATKEAYRFFTELEISATRISIGSGFACETKTETGVFIPTFAAILECAEERYNIAIDIYQRKLKESGFRLENREKILEEEIKKLPLIIADGGIKTPSDMCKALAAGCFTPEMKVNTEFGQKPIKDIKIGEKVYSHDGNIHEVINTINYNKDEELFVINDIECTKNHRFYVIHKKFEYIITENTIHLYAEWISAEELNEDYFLILLE